MICSLCQGRRNNWHIQTSDRFLSTTPENTRSSGQVTAAENGDLPMFSTVTVRRLNEQATLKLAEISRASNNKCNIAEVNAAKDLLERSVQSTQR